MSHPLVSLNPLRTLFLAVSGVLVAATLPACDKSRQLGPPKAVAVSDDGILELSATTFNVRYENPGDPESRSWQQRIPHVVRAIRELDPDVLGIQEALHGQAADLWVSLPDYEFSGIGRDDGKKLGEYSAILYRRDRFWADPADSGTFWLSDQPAQPGSMTWGNEIPRICSWIRLVDRATNRGFYVFNTHWDHRHQGSREQAARLIAERIDARRHADDPVILMGDFNAVETNPAISFLTGTPTTLSGEPARWENGLLETFLHLHPGETHRRTVHGWSGSNRDAAKIDHVLVSPGTRVLSAAVMPNREPMVSDHHPVSARLVFP